MQSFNVTEWTKCDENATEKRSLHYEVPKMLAFTKYMINVNQVQSRCNWSVPGVAYGIDCVTHSSGAIYTDYFYIENHVRLVKEDEKRTKVIAVADIIWEKQCLLKGKIETETNNGTKKLYEFFEKELMATFTEEPTINISTSGTS